MEFVAGKFHKEMNVSDSTTASRALQLLELFQRRGQWSARELTDRLGVGGRTLRRDIDRLRQLGYHITAVRGSEGGYALEAASDMPPMVFEPEEAVAIAVALGTAANTNAVARLQETAVSAMAKMEQVLPTQLRRRVAALRQAIVTDTPVFDGGHADPETLAVLALACRDHEQLLVSYGAADGNRTRRVIEPHRLVPRAKRWYIACWDTSRDDWRMLRVDRIERVQHQGTRFTPRPLTGERAREMLNVPFERNEPEHEVRVIIHAPIDITKAYLRGYAKNLEEDSNNPSQSVWHLRDSRLEVLAAALVWLPWDFHLEGSPELVTLLGRIGQRFTIAAKASQI